MNKQNLLEKNEKILTKQMAEFVYRSFIAQCSLAGIIHSGMKKVEQIEIVARFCGVNIRTIRRWFNGEPAHPSAVRLLFNNYMGFPQHGRWRGWKLEDDRIISPSGEKITPEMIGYLWVQKNEKNMLLQKIRILTQRNEVLEKIADDRNYENIKKAADLLNVDVNSNSNYKKII